MGACIFLTELLDLMLLLELCRELQYFLEYKLHWMPEETPITRKTHSMFIHRDKSSTLKVSFPVHVILANIHFMGAAHVPIPVSHHTETKTHIQQKNIFSLDKAVGSFYKHHKDSTSWGEQWCCQKCKAGSQVLHSNTPESSQSLTKVFFGLNARDLT